MRHEKRLALGRAGDLGYILKYGRAQMGPRSWWEEKKRYIVSNDLKNALHALYTVDRSMQLGFPKYPRQSLTKTISPNIDFFL